MADKYVSATNGSDANQGTKTDPYQTIQHGVDELAALGGGTLHVVFDVYKEHVKMVGARYSNITVKGEPVPTPIEMPSPSAPCHHKPVVDGGGGFFNDRVFHIKDCNHVVLLDLTIQNGDERHWYG